MICLLSQFSNSYAISTKSGPLLDRMFKVFRELPNTDSPDLHSMERSFVDVILRLLSVGSERNGAGIRAKGRAPTLSAINNKIQNNVFWGMLTTGDTGSLRKDGTRAKYYHVTRDTYEVQLSLLFMLDKFVKGGDKATINKLRHMIEIDDPTVTFLKRFSERKPYFIDSSGKRVVIKNDLGEDIRKLWKNFGTNFMMAFFHRFNVDYGAYGGAPLMSDESDYPSGEYWKFLDIAELIDLVTSGTTPVSLVNQLEDLDYELVLSNILLNFLQKTVTNQMEEISNSLIEMGTPVDIQMDIGNGNFTTQTVIQVPTDDHSLDFDLYVDPLDPTIIYKLNSTSGLYETKFTMVDGKINSEIFFDLNLPSNEQSALLNSGYLPEPDYSDPNDPMSKIMSLAVNFENLASQDLFYTIFEDSPDIFMPILEELSGSDINTLFVNYNQMEIESISDSISNDLNIYSIEDETNITLSEFWDKYQEVSTIIALSSANPIGGKQGLRLLAQKSVFDRLNNGIISPSVLKYIYRLSNSFSRQFIDPSFNGLAIPEFSSISVSDAGDITGLGYLQRNPSIYEDSFTSPYVSILWASYGTGNIPLFDYSAENSIRRMFSNDLLNNFNALDIKGEHANAWDAFWNSFDLNFSFNNLFEWGIRNNADELPFVARMYLYLLSSPLGIPNIGRYGFEEIVTTLLA